MCPNFSHFHFLGTIFHTSIFWAQFFTLQFFGHIFFTLFSTAKTCVIMFWKENNCGREFRNIQIFGSFICAPNESDTRIRRIGHFRKNIGQVWWCTIFWGFPRNYLKWKPFRLERLICFTQWLNMSQISVQKRCSTHVELRTVQTNVNYAGCNATEVILHSVKLQTIEFNNEYY